MNRLRISGGSMAFEWAPGVGVGILGNLLVWYKANVQTEDGLKTLRERFERHEAENAELRKAVFEELRESYERFRNTLEEMKVMAATQAGVNKMCANTLESIAKRLELHDAQIVQQNTEIEILKVKGQGGK